MVKRPVFFLSFVLFLCNLQGANIVWGVDGQMSRIIDVPWSQEGRNWFWAAEPVWVNFFFTQTFGATTYSVTSADFGDPQYGYRAVLFEVSKGDLVDAGIRAAREPFWDNCGDVGERIVGKTISRENDESFFLGIVLFDVENFGEAAPVMYGWVQFGLTDDGVAALTSALDLEGGGMIVGGGAVPEPGVSLLLAAGVAFALLKRRGAA